MAKTTKKEETTTSTALAPDSSLAAFQATKDLAVKKSEQLLEIKVVDEPSAGVARQALSEANSMLKAVEEKRKEIKDPYKKIVDKIDSLGNEIKKPLEESITAVKNEIKAYETKKEQEAQAKVKELEEQQAKEREEKTKEEAARKKVADWLVQMQSWFDKSYETCDTPEKLVTLKATAQEYVNKSLPSVPEDLKPQLDNFAKSCATLCDTKAEMLKQADNLSDEQKALAQEKLKLAEEKKALEAREREIEMKEKEAADKAAREAAERKANEERQKLEMQQKAEAPSNIRHVWKFELVEKDKLIPEWIALDEAAVKAYLKENKDKLESGSIINGVKFYQDKTVVA